MHAETQQIFMNRSDYGQISCPDPTVGAETKIETTVQNDRNVEI